jgi:hypothetical protein
MPATFKGIKGKSPLEFLGNIPGPLAIEQLYRMPNETELQTIRHFIAEAMGNKAEFQHLRDLFQSRGLQKGSNALDTLVSRYDSLKDQYNELMNQPMRASGDTYAALDDKLNALASPVYAEGKNLWDRLAPMIKLIKDKPLRLVRKEIGGPPPKPFK